MKFTRSLGVFQSLTISAFVAAALSLLLKNWIGKDWRPASAVAIFTITLLPLLYIVFKEQAQKLRNDVETQLNRLDQPQHVFGSTLHGVIFANEQGLAITYLPAFEIFLNWEEITGYVLFQKDIETYIKGFIDGWIKPPTLPGRAHTLLITSTRTDMPAIPVEIPKADLEFWSDVIDAGKSEPQSLATYFKKPGYWRGLADQRWANNKFLLLWVLFASCGLMWMLKPGVTSMPAFAYFYINMLALIRHSEPSASWPSLVQTLLRARGQVPDSETSVGIADDAIWLWQPKESLNRIALQSLQSVTLEPFQIVGGARTKLTFHRTSGDPTEANLKPERAASIHARLRDLLPNLKLD